MTNLGFHQRTEAIIQPGPCVWARGAKDGDGGINAPRVHPRIYHEAGDNVTINCRIIIPPFVIPSHYPSIHHHP